MPLSEVRAGMSCTGLSVVRGTTPAEFDVEIVDVIRGEPATLGTRILFRVSGPAVDATGIGPGFSGSPIYCPAADGSSRVAGAISEGIGQYGNKVALATPIEDVLGTAAPAPRAARRAAALLRSARPLSSPLTVSGLSGPVRRAVATGARRAGVPLAVAPSSSASFYAPYDLTPGTSVAAGLISGDVTASAIGTVTYRDGAKLWAFGHPLSAAGRRSLPLLDAYVFSIIDNPIGMDPLTTYKLATAGRPVGTLTNDGISAVAGRIGPSPPTIPMTVHARDLTSGRSRTVRMNVADERTYQLGSRLGLASQLGLATTIVDSLRAAPSRMTIRTCVEVRVRQSKRPLGYCKRYFNPSDAFFDLTDAMSMLNGYRFGPLDIRGVSIRTGVRAGVREAFILDADTPRRVRPGQRIRVRLQLQRSRAGRFGISFPYEVPKAARPGRRTLTIRGTGAGGFDLAEIFGMLFGGGGGNRPARSVEELGARIADLGGSDGVRATLSRKGRGRVVHTTGELRIRGKVEVPLTVRKKRD
jgi:hypothetical protein